MIADAEVHLLPRGWEDWSDEPFIQRAFREHPDYPLIKDKGTAEDIVHSCNANGITRALLMGIPCVNDARNRACNDAVQEAARRFPGRFDRMLVVNPTAPGALRYVEEMTAHGFVGVKIIASWQGFRLDSPELDELLGWLEQTGRIFMPHVSHLVQPSEADTPQQLFSIARRYPRLRILAPHMGGGLFLYEGLERAKATLANVRYIASVSATPYMARFGAALAPTKVLFGTDYPYNHEHSQRGLLDALRHDLPLRDRDDVLFANYMAFVPRRAEG